MMMQQTDDRGEVSLRDVTAEDLLVFFQQQLDETAHWMAAFGPPLTDDPEPFLARWERILSDDTRVARTILWNGEVAGNVTSFQLMGDPAVGYCLGREYWGRGIATRGLAAFLEIVTVRPLYARAAQDNIGSLRVLAKCGFVICGEDKGFAGAGVETEEYVLRLD